MIANFFKKTTLFQVFCVVSFLYGCYFISAFVGKLDELSMVTYIKSTGFFFWLILLLLIVRFIIKKNNLTKHNSYALLLIVFMMGIFSEAMLFPNIVFSNIVLLLGFRRIYSLKSGLNTKKKLFDVGFWVGIAMIFYSLSIFYVLLIYVAIASYQKLSLKNLIIPVVGVICPLFIYFTYHFYFDSLDIFYGKIHIEVLADLLAYKTLEFIVPIIFLGVILLGAILKVTPRVVSISQEFKISWGVLIVQLIISTVIVVLSPIKNGSELLFIMFPSAIIITNFIQGFKSVKIRNVILYLFLFLTIGIYLIKHT